MNEPLETTDLPDVQEDEIESKIPTKYKHLWDSDGFEKFNKSKDWWD